MTVEFALAASFGISFIASLFLAVVWGRLVFDGQHNDDRKFFLTSLGLLVIAMGVGIISFNRTLVALVGQELYPALLIFAGITLVTGKLILLTGTTFGLAQKAFTAFGILSLAWIGFCLWWFV